MRAGVVFANILALDAAAEPALAFVSVVPVSGVGAVGEDNGEYNTCPHLCEYCYANASKEIAVNNYNAHKNDIFGKTITGK